MTGHEIRVDGVILGQPETELAAHALRLASLSPDIADEREAAWLNLLGLRLVDERPRPTILTDSEGRTVPATDLRMWVTDG